MPLDQPAPASTTFIVLSSNSTESRGFHHTAIQSNSPTRPLSFIRVRHQNVSSVCMWGGCRVPELDQGIQPLTCVVHGGSAVTPDFGGGIALSCRTPRNSAQERTLALCLLRSATVTELASSFWNTRVSGGLREGSSATRAPPRHKGRRSGRFLRGTVYQRIVGAPLHILSPDRRQ